MIDTMRTEGEGPQFRPYFVDPDGAEAARRSLPVLIAGRLCYMCRQGYEDDQIVGEDPQDFVDLIVGHCSTSQDFLLPDTPMKEAIFRVLLGNSNEPMDAEQISAVAFEQVADDTGHVSDGHSASSRQQRLLLHWPGAEPRQTAKTPDVTVELARSSLSER